MSYGIVLSPEARHALARIDVPIRQKLLRQLEILGEYPTELSQPSHWPYREKCQMFPLDVDHEGWRWELRTLFQYSQDEQTLQVWMMGFSKLTIEEAERREPPLDESH